MNKTLQLNKPIEKLDSTLATEDKAGWKEVKVLAVYDDRVAYISDKGTMELEDISYFRNKVEMVNPIEFLKLVERYTTYHHPTATVTQWLEVLKDHNLISFNEVDKDSVKTFINKYGLK